MLPRIFDQLEAAVGGPALLEVRPQLRDVARHWAKAPDAEAAGHVVVFSSPEPLTGREEERANAAGVRPAGSRPASASRLPRRGQADALVPTPPSPRHV